MRIGMGPRRGRFVRASIAFSLAVAPVVLSTGPASAQVAVLGLRKAVSLPAPATVAPATNFTYFLSYSCSSLSQDCVGATIVDVLPPELSHLATDVKLAGNFASANYDAATGTAKSPSLAHLAMGSELHLHPLDIERVGSSDGADVKVTSKRASMVFKVVADESVVRGSAWVPFNQPGPNIGELIDASEPVTDVRVESF